METGAHSQPPGELHRPQDGQEGAPSVPTLDTLRTLLCDGTLSILGRTDYRHDVISERIDAWWPQIAADTELLPPEIEQEALTTIAKAVIAYEKHARQELPQDIGIVRGFLNDVAQCSLVPPSQRAATMLYHSPQTVTELLSYAGQRYPFLSKSSIFGSIKYDISNPFEALDRIGTRFERLRERYGPEQISDRDLQRLCLAGKKVPLDEIEQRTQQRVAELDQKREAAAGKPPKSKRSAERKMPRQVRRRTAKATGELAINASDGRKQAPGRPDNGGTGLAAGTTQAQQTREERSAPPKLRITLRELSDLTGHTPGVVRSWLTKAGFPSSVENIKPSGKAPPKKARGFPVEVLEYLEEHPIPDYAPPGTKTTDAVARNRYGCSLAHLLRVIDDYAQTHPEEPPVQSTKHLSAETHRLCNYFDKDTIQRIDKIIEGLPRAAPTDVLTRTFSDAIDPGFAESWRRKHGIKTQFKRHHEGLGFGSYMDKASVDALRQAWNLHQDSVTKRTVARKAGITLAGLRKALARESKSAQAPAAAAPIYSHSVWTKNEAEEILRRFKRSRLPPNLMPATSAIQIVNLSTPEGIKSTLRKIEQPIALKLPGTGGKGANCFTWGAVLWLGHKYGYRNGVSVDPARLRTDSVYARQLQLRFASTSQLADNIIESLNDPKEHLWQPDIIGWKTATDIAGLLGVQPRIVRRIFRTAASGQVLEIPVRHGVTKPHLRPDKAAEAARYIAARRLMSEPHLPLGIPQIALLANMQPRAMFERILAHNEESPEQAIPYTSETPNEPFFNGESIAKALSLFGAQLPDASAPFRLNPKPKKHIPKERQTRRPEVGSPQSLWRPGDAITIARSSNATQPLTPPVHRRQPGESTLGLPDSPKIDNPPRHRHIAPGEWRPAVAMPTDKAGIARMFISSTERLTVHEISSRLGIRARTVRLALRQIDRGDTRPQKSDGKSKYSGPLLRAVREQLVGVPLDFMVRSLTARDRDYEAARQVVRTFLERNTYKEFPGERYAPGVLDLINQHAETLKARASESSKPRAAGENRALEQSKLAERRSTPPSPIAPKGDPVTAAQDEPGDTYGALLESHAGMLGASNPAAYQQIKELAAGRILSSYQAAFLALRLNGHTRPDTVRLLGRKFDWNNRSEHKTEENRIRTILQTLAARGELLEENLFDWAFEPVADEL